MPTPDSLLTRAAALLARTLEEHETCEHIYDCTCMDALSSRLELDILALLDEVKILIEKGT